MTAWRRQRDGADNSIFAVAPPTFAPPAQIALSLNPTGDHDRTCTLDGRNRLLAPDGRIVVEELVDGASRREMREQVVDRYARSGKASAALPPLDV